MSGWNAPTEGLPPPVRLPPAAQLPSPPATTPGPSRGGRARAVVFVTVVLFLVVGGVALVLASREDGGGRQSGAGTPEEPAGPPVPADELALVRADLGEVEIAWSNPTRDDLRGFVILRDDKRIGSVPAEVSSFVDSRSLPGRTYRYVVVARYPEGAEVRSDPIRVRTPKPPPVAEARAAGSYDVKVRITEAHGYTDLRTGQRRSGSWTLRPRCDEGACNVVATTWMFGEKAKLSLERDGAVYTGSGRTSVSRCFGEDVPGTMTVDLRVISGELSAADVWMAARIEGTIRFSSATYYPGGSLYCPAAGFTGSFTAR